MNTKAIGQQTAKTAATWSSPKDSPAYEFFSVRNQKPFPGNILCLRTYGALKALSLFLFLWALVNFGEALFMVTFRGEHFLYVSPRHDSRFHPGCRDLGRCVCQSLWLRPRHCDDSGSCEETPSRRHDCPLDPRQSSGGSHAGVGGVWNQYQDGFLKLRTGLLEVEGSSRHVSDSLQLECPPSTDRRMESTTSPFHKPLQALEGHPFP